MEKRLFLKANWAELKNKSGLELVTVLCSNLPSLDDHIKSYLLNQSDMTFPTAVNIILRSSITPELILQLNGLKEYLNVPSYEVFYKCYTRTTE